MLICQHESALDGSVGAMITMTGIMEQGRLLHPDERAAGPGLLLPKPGTLEAAGIAIGAQDRVVPGLAGGPGKDMEPGSLLGGRGVGIELLGKTFCPSAAAAGGRGGAPVGAGADRAPLIICSEPLFPRTSESLLRSIHHHHHPPQRSVSTLISPPSRPACPPVLPALHPGRWRF